jgi:PAS domain S-box-containing protein
VKKKHNSKAEALFVSSSGSALSPRTVGPVAYLGVIFPFLIGLIVLVGWFFHSPHLTALVPGFAAMQPNTAGGLLMAALSLALLLRETKPRIAVGSILAVLVFALGLLTMAEYVFRSNLGIDTLLVRVSSSEPSNPFPARMSPFSAFCFLTAAIGLIFLPERQRHRRLISEFATVAALLTALLGLVGHSYGTSAFYRVGPYNSMAIHTAIAFFALGCGILAARPERGLVSLLTRSTSGSLLARRLLPAALLIPLVVGWFRVKGEQAGYFEMPLGAALLVTSLVVIFVALIWRTAVSLDRSDLARQHMENALRESEGRYRSLFESIDQGFCVIEVLFDDNQAPLDFRFLEINPAFERHTGLQRALGRTMRELVPNHDQHWFDSYGRVAMSGEPIRFESYSDSLQRWFDVYAFRVGRPEERHVAILFAGTNDRKRAEAAAQRLAAIVESSQDAIISKDLNGVITTWNAGAESLLGYSVEEAVGQPVTMLIPADHAGEESRFLDGIRHGETFKNFETVRRHKNGTLIDVSLTVSPIKDNNGRVTGASKIMRDITARKRAAELIQKSEQHLRDVLDSLFAFVGVLKPDGTLLEVNRALVEVSGFPMTEVIGKKFWDCYWWNGAPDVQAQLRAAVERAAAGQPSRFDTIARLAGDRTLAIDFTVAPMRDIHGRITHLIPSGVDISERKQAADKLRESEERYRALFTSIDEGYCIIEMIFNENQQATDYRFVEVNPAFEKQAGLRGATGKRMLELVSYIEPHWLENYGRVALTGVPIRFADEYKSLGSWFEVFAFRVGDPVRRQVAVLFNNITDRKRGEQALRESEERFRAMADNIAPLAWMANPDGHIFFYNKRWYEYTGTTLEEMQGWGWERVHHPEELQRMLPNWKNALATGKPWEDIFPLRRKDGQYGWFLSRAFPLRDTAGNITRWFGTNTDITELRMTQEELKKAKEELQLHADSLEVIVADRTAKLHEIIGELEAFSYSLSHDMRAPLRAIQGYTQMALEECGEKAGPLLDRVISAAVRLDRMIQEVLSYTRISRQEIRIGRVDVDRLVHEIISERPELQQPRAEVIVKTPLLPMHGHEASLTQCLTNLLGNAVKFVPRGVKPRVVVSSETRDDEVRLWIEDNGIGIESHTQTKLFEMFYRINSEKDYEGTGIGLAIVRKAVERMGGTVGVESEPGRGSRFWVQLPKGD